MDNASQYEAQKALNWNKLAPEKNYNISIGDNLKSASTENIEKLLEIKMQKHEHFHFFRHFT